jgi:hypothetical protein
MRKQIFPGCVSHPIPSTAIANALSSPPAQGGQTQAAGRLRVLCSTSKTWTTPSGLRCLVDTRPRALSSPFAKSSEAAILGVRPSAQRRRPVCCHQSSARRCSAVGARFSGDETAARPSRALRAQRLSLRRRVAPLALRCRTRPLPPS